MTFNFTRHIKGDRHIWYILFLLCIFSSLVVYSSISALAYKKTESNTELLLLKHLFLIGTGLCITFFVHKLDFSKYIGILKLCLWLCIPLLIYTLLFGISVGGARRWIGAYGFSFQTSDLIRLILIANLSAMLARRQNIEYKPKDLWEMVAWIVFFVGALAFTSFSTSVILGLTCFIIMWIGRVPSKYLMNLVLGSLLFVMCSFGAGLVYKKYFNEEVGRLNTVIDRSEEFTGFDFDGNGFVGGEFGSKSDQKNYALVAVASGGWAGKGPGNSSQKNILPDAFSDFVFSILVEEYGIIGGTFLVLLYIWLLYRGVWNIENTSRAFTGLLSIGLTLSIVLQAFAHIIINVGLVPVTGQVLPLISSGGTSIWFTCIALGIVLSVTKTPEEA